MKLRVPPSPFIYALAAALAFAPLHTFAAETAAKPPAAQKPAARKAQVDPKAEQLLKSMSELYRKATALKVEVKTTMTMKMAGINQEMPSTYSFTAQRPNKIAMILKDGIGATIVSDGKKMHMHMPMLNQYQEMDAPADIRGITEQAGAPPGGSDILTTGLLSDNPYETLMEDVERVEYVGAKKEGAEELHHLRITQEELSWDMYLQGGKAPLLSRVVADMSKTMAEGLPVEARQDVSVVMTMTYSNWDLSPKLAPADFAFKVPEGAKKVASFEAPSDPESAEEEEDATKLVGQPAAAFSLPLLEGGTGSLAQHKGKNIVILDFWATWCGPCVRAMPILEKVAASYKDKGVILYAVNEQEEEKTIRDFLKKRKLSVTVALDKEGSVAEQYKVTGIPQTVIIDRDGIIRAVHVGFSPDLETILKQDLDKLTR